MTDHQDRLIVLRDNSSGTSEAVELGAFTGVIVGAVDEVDDDGIPVKGKTKQGFLQPRNWHELVKPKSPFQFGVKDRRYDLCLIVDHGNDFAGWKLDENDKSPFLDDWLGDSEAVNNSSRLVDDRDPKGRTALISQLVIIKDDHRQEYTAALNMGPEVGNHDKASAGYVYDNNKNFMGQLSTFFTTNPADEIGKGRESTPYGYLGVRHDAHVEFPGVAHGRHHIAREFCDDYDEMPSRSGGGGGAGGGQGSGGEGEPQVHFYKSRLMFDHKKAGEDTGLPKENAQLRPVYHCIDVPERKPYKPSIFIDNSVHITNNNSTIIIIIIIVNGGGGTTTGGGGVKINPLNPGNPVIPLNPGQPGQQPGRPGFPAPPGGGFVFPAPEPTPPPGGGDGRIICIPLSHNPPLVGGLQHRTHGYIAISEDGDGSKNAWVGGQTGAIGPNSANVFQGGWDQLVSIPAGTPTGMSPVTDGSGGFTFEDLHPKTEESVDPQAVDILFEALGYDKSRGSGRVEQGYVWDPDEDDLRVTRLQYTLDGEVIETALMVDGRNGYVQAFGERVVTKPAGTTDGYVPTADTEFGVVWVDPTVVGRSLPKGYITGFGLEEDTAYPSIVNVGAGICRDSTDAMDINVGDPGVDYLTNGGPLFNDALVGSDTVITGSSSHGTSGAVNQGNSALSGSILPLLNGRALTGNVSLAAAAGGIAVVTATVAGTTRFLSELAVGDLIGNATCGYKMVVEIANDEYCAVIHDFVAAGAHANQSFTVYENVQVQVGAGPSVKISEIGTAGTQLYGPTYFNGGVEVGGPLAVIVGQPTAFVTWTYPTPVFFPSWIYLWARAKADGTSTLSWSTQRTTPYTPATLAGYSFWRRVGVLPIGDDNFIPYFTQDDQGPVRIYEYDDTFPGTGNINWAVNSNLSSNIWFRIYLNQAVPPTSSRALVWLALKNPVATNRLMIRRSLSGGPTASRAKGLYGPIDRYASGEFEIQCDEVQAIDYVMDAADAGRKPGNVHVIGYYDKP